jgi:two-component system osmolarity sensor histidine kinase EnvZ
VQQRTEMLAGVSHDLKTPLTRMRLQLAMMPKDTDTESMLGDLAEMERMLSEYLEFARGENGEAAEATELAALVAEAAADCARTRDATERIALKVAEPLTVAVRRYGLKRCLVNLIDNALKYGRRVEVGVRRAGKSAEIMIDDDGPGIPSERREEAFRPFHRLDEGRNLQMGGVGLGLAIARDIARGHGGDVILEGSPLGGLRARLSVPL